MKPSDFIKEHAVKPIKQAKPQNIEQLKEQCYKCASDSISIRATLAESKIRIDPWIAEKIKTAQQCLEAVSAWIKDAELMEDAGGMGAASIAAVATPLFPKKVIKRKMKEVSSLPTTPTAPSTPTANKPTTDPQSQGIGSDDPAEQGALEKIANDPTLKQDLDVIKATAQGQQPGTTDPVIDQQTLELIKSNTALKAKYDELLKKVI